MQAGGAILVGYESFSASSACSAASAPAQPLVSVVQSQFANNLATDRGGGIGLQAGNLVLQVRFKCIVGIKELLPIRECLILLVMTRPPDMLT